jgi:hypothetical protein
VQAANPVLFLFKKENNSKKYDLFRVQKKDNSQNGNNQESKSLVINDLILTFIIGGNFYELAIIIKQLKECPIFKNQKIANLTIEFVNQVYHPYNMNDFSQDCMSTDIYLLSEQIALFLRTLDVIFNSYEKLTIKGYPFQTEEPGLGPLTKLNIDVGVTENTTRIDLFQTFLTSLKLTTIFKPGKLKPIQIYDIVSESKILELVKIYPVNTILIEFEYERKPEISDSKVKNGVKTDESQKSKSSVSESVCCCY